MFRSGCLGSGKNHPFPLKKSRSICFKRVPESHFWKLTFLYINISIPWMGLIYIYLHGCFFLMVKHGKCIDMPYMDAMGFVLIVR